MRDDAAATIAVPLPFILRGWWRNIVHTPLQEALFSKNDLHFVVSNSVLCERSSRKE